MVTDFRNWLDTKEISGFARKVKDIERPHYYEFSPGDEKGTAVLNYKNLSVDLQFWNQEPIKSHLTPFVITDPYDEQP